MSACAIALRGLHRRFAQGGRVVDALAGLDAEIAAGSLTAIVGRSGCGKTTLLRAIAGLEHCERGSLGFSVPAPRIAMAFQEPRLLPWKSVGENIELAVRALPAAERAARVAAVLAQVGLADCAALAPAALSGGMAQRVSLARALVSEPDVLLLDEPFSALDALTRAELHREFAALHRQRGMTTLLVTHDLAEAVQLADRVIHLADGRVRHDWRIALPHPRTPGDPAAAQLTANLLAAVLDAPAASPTPTETQP